MCVYLQNLMEAFVPHKLHSVFFDPFLCSVLFCSHFFNYDVFLSLDSSCCLVCVLLSPTLRCSGRGGALAHSEYFFTNRVLNFANIL